eukprot:gene160-biopygen21059
MAGRGGGGLGQGPWQPGTRGLGRPACQNAKKTPHRTRKSKKNVTGRIWQDRTLIFPMPPKCCGLARIQLATVIRRATSWDPAGPHPLVSRTPSSPDCAGTGPAPTGPAPTGLAPLLPRLCWNRASPPRACKPALPGIAGLLRGLRRWSGDCGDAPGIAIASLRVTKGSCVDGLDHGEGGIPAEHEQHEEEADPEEVSGAAEGLEHGGVDNAQQCAKGKQTGGVACTKKKLAAKIHLCERRE